MRTSIIFISCLVLAGCATNRTAMYPSELLQTGWSPVSGQTCRLLEVAGGLPGETDLFDMTAARAALAAVPASARAARPYGAMEIGFAANGELNRKAMVSSSLDPEVSAGLLASVVATAPAGIGDPAAGWGVLVVATAGDDGDTFRVHPMEFCPMHIVNDREVSRLLAQAPADAGLALQPGRQMAVLVDVFMDSMGNVTQTRIAQSTGNVALDERVMYIVGRIDFAPSLYNRRPFEVVNRIPLTITAPYQ